MTDALPAGVTLVSATATQGSCAGSTTTLVTCNLGSLANGAGAVVTIVVTTSAAGTLSNTATITGAETDSDLANNTSTATTAVVAANSANLALTKTDSPDPATAGANVTYTLTVSNGGPMGATNVVLTDTLPAGVTQVSLTPSQGSCGGAGAITCNLGALASGASATVVIVVTPAAAGTLSNTATVTAMEPDPVTTNNSASQTTTVNASAPPPTPSANLRVKKVDSPDPVTVGGNVTYTVTVANDGPTTAAGVSLTDILLGDTTFVSSTPSQGSCTGAGPVTCALGDLANGASATLTMIAKANAPRDLVNIAIVTSATPDSNVGNNVAMERTRVRPVAPEPEVRPGKIEFNGVVQSMPASGHTGAWKVQGLTVEVSQNTEVKGDPKVGSTVKVEGALTPEGVVQAKEIHTANVKEQRPAKRDKDDDDKVKKVKFEDDERPGKGKGDKNHKHTGPPGHEDDDEEDDD